MGGRFIKAVIGVLAVGAGLATAQPWLVAAGLSLASSALLTPKIAGAGERQASETTLQLGEGPRMVGFGEFATGPMLLDPA